MKFKLAYAVWFRHAVAFRRVWQTNIAVNFADPLIYLMGLGLGMGTLIREVNGISYLSFIAGSMAAYTSCFTATNETTYRSYVRMTYSHVYDSLLATPVSVSELILGEVCWAATKSMGYSTLVIFVLAGAGFVHSMQIVLVIPWLFVSGILFAALGLCATAKVQELEMFNWFSCLVTTPMVLLSGAMFPLKSPAASAAESICPLAMVVRLCRASSEGRMFECVQEMTLLLVLAATLTVLATRMMQRRLII